MRAAIVLLSVVLAASPALAQCFGGRCAARRAARQQNRAMVLQAKAMGNHRAAMGANHSYGGAYQAASYTATSMSSSYGCAGSSMSSYQTYSAPISYGCFGSQVAPATAVPEPPVE